MTWARLVGLALAWLVCVPAAWAGPGKPTAARAAVAQLEATYQPIAQLAAGPARVQKACADREKLRAAVAALPRKMPAGGAVDDDAWGGSVTSLGLAIENLVASCTAPDQKIRRISGAIETAAEHLVRVEEDVQVVLDEARPRALLPAMKRFQTTLQRWLRAPAKQTCKRHGELARLLDELVMPPPHTNTQKWEQAHALIAQNLDQVKQARCGKRRGSAIEELADVLTQVHDGFYQLVLQLPPRDG